MLKTIFMKKAAMFIVGIACRTSNTPQAAPHDIPALWDRFFRENVSEKITNKASDEIIALYCDYEADHTAPYTIVLGHIVKSKEQIPEGMMLKEVPEANYLQFDVKGDHPDSLISTWNEIWQMPLKRAYTYDFEVYKKSFFDDPEKELQIYINVE